MLMIYALGILLGFGCILGGFAAGAFMFVIGALLMGGSIFMIVRIQSAAKKSPVRYIGSLGSQTFHRPSCRAVKMLSTENKKVYDPGITAEQLRSIGMQPCKKCKPR